MYLILFLLYFALGTALLFVVQYFLSLFSDKRENYNRDELTDFRKILVSQWQKLLGDDTQTAYTGIALGVVLGLLLTSWGSFVTSSILFPVLLYFLLPLLKSRFSVSEKNQENFFIRLLYRDLPFFQAFSLAVIAQIFVASYARDINFLWAVINALIIFMLMLIKSGTYKLPVDLIKSTQAANTKTSEKKEGIDPNSAVPEDAEIDNSDNNEK